MDSASFHPSDRQTSTIVLAPQGRQPSAVGVSRRFGKVRAQAASGMCAIAQSAIEPQLGDSLVGLRLDSHLVVWFTYYSAACVRRLGTVGSRRRQGAAVPIGTKKVVDS